MSSPGRVLRSLLTAYLLAIAVTWLAGGLIAAQGAASQTATAQAPTPQIAAGPVRIRFETDLGSFDVEVDVARAPATAANFLKYVDGGFYDGGQVHRSARLETQATRR